VEFSDNFWDLVHSPGRIFTALSCTNITERLLICVLTEMHDLLDSSALGTVFNNNQNIFGLWRNLQQH
jgi:hypothetical protein